MVLLAFLAWGGARLMKAVSPASSSRIPVTRVKRGDVTVTVSAKGELSGGHTEMLSAPMTGGGDMAIIYLREAGELVNPGDVVVKFDTTEQEFKLKEAEADLAEAQEQVVQTQEPIIKPRKKRLVILCCKPEIRCARRRATRTAPQSTSWPISWRAKTRWRSKPPKTTSGSSNTTRPTAPGHFDRENAVAIRRAALNKAKVKAETARQNIDNMVLKAKSGGYVSIQQNSNGNFFMYGMQLPSLQVGDTVNSCGMAVAPDSGFAELGSDRQHRRASTAATYRRGRKCKWPLWPCQARVSLVR